MPSSHIIPISLSISRELAEDLGQDLEAMLGRLAADLVRERLDALRAAEAVGEKIVFPDVEFHMAIREQNHR